MSRQTNWAGNHAYSFRLETPRSLEELRMVVAAEPRLRVLGSRHSFNGICDGEVAVSLAEVPSEIVVDEDARTVTCGGATTYGALAEVLIERGLALHNLASLPHICVAGAIATGTHGSGDRNGNLATAVAGLEFLTASGELRSVRRGDPDFDGTVVSLGALGVVTRVTLDVEPAYDVAQRVYPGVGWGHLVGDFAEIWAAGYSVSAFTDWSERGAAVWVKSREEVPPARLLGYSATTEESHVIPGLDPVNCTPQRGVAGVWAERLPHFRMGFMPSSGAEIQSEYHVPREHTGAAIEAIRAVGASLREVLMICEIRTVAADSLWLSPQHERDTVSFHFTWHREAAAVLSAVAILEAALAPYSARPHWGKVFLAGPAGSARYPWLADFLELKARWDPAEKFTNDWLRTHAFADPA
jgi:xylitol oxidase